MAQPTRQQRRAAERARRKRARARPGPTAAASGALAVGLLAAAHPAPAATFTVTNASDGIPAPPGSLREAIEAANAAPGPDVVDFAAGVSGTIVLDDPDDGGPVEAQLVVTDSVEIQGPGAGVLAVSGNDEGRVFYILYSEAGTPFDVTISGLTITGGATPLSGGGIADLGANLVLDEVAVTGNDAGGGCCPAVGGGVYMGNAAASLTVRDSVISGNSAGIGGGIGTYYGIAALTVENTEVSGNQASLAGGGIEVFYASGDVTLDTVVLSGNTADLGGGGMLGLYLGGQVTVRGSDVVDNDASTFSGGGLALIYPAGDVLVEETTISGNDAGVEARGGGIYLYDGEGLLTIRRSTIAGNTVGGDGGGAFVSATPLDVENSTISGNTAGLAGGGLAVYAPFYVAAAVRHSTVAGNTAGDDGGGLYLYSPGSLVLAHSIVADNAAANGPDLYAGNGTFVALYSLIESPGAAPINDQGGNVFNQDPQLGPLAGNGGPTATHLPAPASPAVDAGSLAFAPPPATDQRLLPRVAGGRIDMGAVELQPQTLQLTFAATAVGEAAGTVTLTVTRTGDPAGAVAADFATADGTAVNPDDYLQGLGTVNFADGDAEPKSFQVTIVNDDADEPDETFTVTLSNPQGGATLGAPAAAVVTILDDDEPAPGPVEIPTLADVGRVLMAGLLGLGGMLLLRRRNRGAAAAGGLAAPALVFSLALADAAAALPAPKAQKRPGEVQSASVHPAAGAQQGPERPAVVPRRPSGAETRVSTLAAVRVEGEVVHLRLADGTRLAVDAGRLLVRDRRHRPDSGERGGRLTAAGERRRNVAAKASRTGREERRERLAERFDPRRAASRLAAGQPVVVRIRRGADGAVERVRVVVAPSLAAAHSLAARPAKPKRPD